MSQDRALMVATTAAMIEQFNKSNIELLNSMGIAVDVVGNFDKGNPISTERLEQFKTWITEHDGKLYNYPAERSPVKVATNYKAEKQLEKIIRSDNYMFIHCHAPIGSVIARTAAKRTQTPALYTAHGFHFYKGAPLLNWVIYYPTEKFLSRFTDTLITINKEDYNRAKKFHAKKVAYIPGVGIDLETLQNRKNYKQNEIRHTIGIEDDDFVCITVGELIKRKNIAVVIDALGILKKKGLLDRIHYLICGKGPLEKELLQQAQSLDIDDHVHFMGFRNDIDDICKEADLFVFMSKQEGLPVALMEAMACGLPVICSDIRGNTDLIENKKSGVIVESTADAVAEAIIKLKENEPLREEYASAAMKTIRHFDLTIVEAQMSKLYTEIITDVRKKSEL